MHISGSLHAVQISWQGVQGVWKDRGVTEVVESLCGLSLQGFTLDNINRIHTGS